MIWRKTKAIKELRSKVVDLEYRHGNGLNSLRRDVDSLQLQLDDQRHRLKALLDYFELNVKPKSGGYIVEEK